MKSKDHTLLEQAYLKVLKEDSEMNFLSQQDPREAFPEHDEDTINVNSQYEKLVDDVVEKIVNEIQGVTLQAETKYPDDSGKFYTDIITRLTDHLKKQSR